MQYNDFLIIGVTPTNNETNVAVTTSIEVLFSEALDDTTVTPSTVYLQNASTGGVVTATLQYIHSEMKAVITPSASLSGLTTYRTTVLGGEKGIMTLDGEYMFETKYYEFTTADSSGEVTDPDPEPTEPSFLLDVSASYPKDGDVHISPESIKILFTDALDPLSVTDQTVYVLKKKKPAELNIIDLMTEYSPSKSILDPIDNPITLEQSNLISIQLNQGDLEENAEYTVIVRESVQSTTGSQLGEAYSLGFYSILNPIYGDPERVRSDVGTFLRNVSDNDLYRYMHEVSINARDIVSNRDQSIDLVSDVPHYIKQYVRTKTAYDLVLNAFLANSSSGMRKLGDLTIEANQSPKEIIREFKSRIKSWEDQLHGHTNRGYAKPSGVVKGESGDTYPEHLTRTDFTGMEG